MWLDVDKPSNDERKILALLLAWINLVIEIRPFGGRYVFAQNQTNGSSYFLSEQNRSSLIHARYDPTRGTFRRSESTGSCEVIHSEQDEQHGCVDRRNKMPWDRNRRVIQSSTLEREAGIGRVDVRSTRILWPRSNCKQ